MPLCFDMLPRVTVTAPPVLLLAGLLLPPGLAPKEDSCMFCVGLKHKHMHLPGGRGIIPSFLSEERNRKANTAADESY